jgi:putative component of toxin-antitoxin plasmid stabilization module
MTDKKSQSDKFKDVARDLECDEDEARWDERLKKVAKGKPSDKKSE